MAQGKTTRLEYLSRPLRPVRAPWYVRHPLPPGLDAQFPADGWYWIPDGHQVAVFLAHSYELAAHNLRSEVERLEREAA